MPEPMTLEEAKRRYDAASAELARICQGPRANFRMRIPAQRDDSDLILGDALVALRDMTRTVVVERDDKAALVKALNAAERALKPVNAHVYNDNGDITVSGAIKYEHYVNAHFALKSIRAALAAVGEET